MIEKGEVKNSGPFSIHSFGFGADFDEELMAKISKVKNGTFYFVKELRSLDEAFSNALGGILSVVAKDVSIKLKNVARNSVEGVKIGKTYSEFWNKVN